MGNWKEKAGVGSTVRGEPNRRGNIRSDFDVLTWSSREGEVHGGVREGASLGRGIEVLDQGGEGVEDGRGGIPSYEDFTRVGF